MIIFDFLYKICYGPFQKLEGGRSAALAWTTQIAGFTLLAIFNAVFYKIGVNLSSVMIMLIGGASAYGAYCFFNRVYVIGKRNVGHVRFPVLMGILIFILLMISIICMLYSLAKY